MKIESEEKLIELSRRAVACSYWYWRPGLATRFLTNGKVTDTFARTITPPYCLAKYCSDISGVSVEEERAHMRIHCVVNSEKGLVNRSPYIKHLLPDFTDVATIGCLLKNVRVAWESQGVHTRIGVNGWEVRDTYCTVINDQPSTIVCGLDWVGRGSSIDPTGEHPSEIEALVVALEAASGN